MAEIDLSGTWHSKYTFHNDIEDNGVSEHDVQIHKTGNQVIMQSVPNEEGSYLIMKLTLDDKLLTGTWREETSPTGKYKRQTYYGAVQLKVESSNRIAGKHVCENHALEIIAGDWELTRTS